MPTVPFVCRHSVEVSLWHEESGRSSGVGGARWLVRAYNSYDPESKKRKYLNQTIH